MRVMRAIVIHVLHLFIVFGVVVIVPTSIRTCVRVFTTGIPILTKCMRTWMRMLGHATAVIVTDASSSTAFAVTNNAVATATATAAAATAPVLWIDIVHAFVHLRENAASSRCVTPVYPTCPVQ